MLFIVMALFFFKQGNEWITGILLGISGLIKLPLIFPSGYFSVRGKWKVVAGGLFIALSVIGLSLYLMPMSLNNTWLERCILSISGNPIPAYNNQSLSAVLARIFMPGNLSWEPISSTSAYTQAINIGNLLIYIPVLIVLFVGRKSTQTPQQYILEFCIFLVCSLLTSPISWSHYFVILLIPTAIYLGYDKKIPPQSWTYSWFIISIIFISLPVQFTYTLFERTDKVFFLSINFIGGLLLYLFLFITWIQIKRTDAHLKRQMP